MLFVSISAKKKIGDGKRRPDHKATLWINIWDVIMMWITINMDHTNRWHLSQNCGDTCQESCGAVRENYQNTPAVIILKYILK